jgi:exodeoxyribonuclease VII large subunit
VAYSPPEPPQLNLRFEPDRRVYPVSELSSTIRDVFYRDFRDIWVTGEISGCKTAASGHLYFALKDARAQLRCVVFKSSARWLKFRPQDGISVLARGSLDVYESRGEYQLIVESLEPQGAGARQLAFEQLKRKLELQGLFSAERKRALPRLPRRLGIITSPAGAVISDMLHILRRRFPGLHIRIFPALMQGEGAVEQVCRGIDYFSRATWADVLIVARGGGSIEDLWTFNEEAIAMKIAHSSVPVVSAIGHETDFTIADFVADLRAPTPSAAAELVICTRDSLLEQLDSSQERLVRAVRYQILMCSKRFQQRGLERAEALIHRSLGRRAQRLDELEFRLRAAPQRWFTKKAKTLQDLSHRLHVLDIRTRLARAHSRLASTEAQLVQLVKQRLSHAQQEVRALNAQLTQLSPLAVLNRGYSIVQREDGRVVRESSEVNKGDSIRIRLYKGDIGARVEEIGRSNS